jgi:hypothetical protein
MKNFLTRLFVKPAEPAIQVKIIASNMLTLMQWRKQGQLVADAIRINSDPAFQMMLAVLKNEHPAHNGFVSVGTSIEDRAAHQAKCEGYEACLNKIYELSQPFTVSKPLQATFQTPSTL